MQATRRSFFMTAMSLGVATSALPLLSACGKTSEEEGVSNGLIPDPKGLLDLPPGFTYTTFSHAGEAMSDGLTVPESHDGMTAFPVEGDPDRCILVRNHELDPDEANVGPYAGKTDVSDAVKAMSYDLGADGMPMPGGTVTLVYNLKTGEVEKSWLSLSGTLRNCSGGITPWGSWLSCEESRLTAGEDGAGKDHGYVFEVSPYAEGLAEPVPLKAMGRFNHEATATDPRTGIVYLTEDEGDSVFYRFIPNVKGKLAEGGRLQVMAIQGAPKADTRNWDQPGLYPMGDSWPVEWIDIDDVEAPEGDLRIRGHEKGAALFARGEGMSFAVEKTGNAIYFACTSGGPAESGQIWKYSPGPMEGEAGEGEAPAMLTLVYESQDPADMDMCDNIVASPWGDITVCEDGRDDQYVRGVTPDGRVYNIARNAHADQSEFAGACWAPDGETLFVNMQGPHMSIAIRGPWASIARV